MQRPNTRETLKLAGITALWLSLSKGLIWIGERATPGAWKAKISLQSFLMGCQIVTAVAGLSLSFAWLSRPRAVLALTRPRLRELTVTALGAPAFLVLTTVIALQAALPTLLEEMRTRGAGASRQNAGEFGRMLEQGPLLATLLWGAILAATTEELLFRGALWSLLDRLAQTIEARLALRAKSAWFGARADGGRGSTAPGRESLPTSWVQRASPAILGLVPTVGAAFIFGLMHGDVHGGVGIVRLASAMLLGLGAGALRWWTKSLFAPVLLHFLNNTLVIGHARKWFTRGGPELPLIDGVSNLLLGIALCGLCGAGIFWAVLGVWERRAERERMLGE
jgi:membrane protease YdiL (CAAX protease family)